MSDLSSKFFLTLFLLFFACGTLYADEDISFDKLNFKAEESDQSQMGNTQTTQQGSAEVQEQDNVSQGNSAGSSQEPTQPPGLLAPTSASVGASYQPWQLNTQFRSGVTFYNNFLSTRNDPKDEIVFQNGLTFLFSNKNSPFHLNVDYEPTYKAYYRYSNSDSLDQNLAASYGRRFGRFYDKGGELLAYSSQTQTIEDGSRTKEFTNSYSNEFGYDINKYISSALIYNNSITNFLTETYKSSSYSENTIGPRIYYHIRPHLDLYVQSEYATYSYNQDASRNSNNLATSVGMRGTVSEKTFFKIEGGLQSGSQSGGGQNSFVAEAIIDHHFTPKTDLTLVINKGTQQSTDTSGVYNYWLLSSQLDYKYSPKTTVSFLISWQNDSYSTATTDPVTLISTTQQRQDYVDTESLTLTHDFNQKLTLTGAISREGKLSNFKEFEYDEYTFELSLIYDF